MEVFPFIFVFILASTYSVTRANFLSCEETHNKDYLECKPENSSGFVKVSRRDQDLRNWNSFDVKVCGTPEIVTVSNDSFSDLADMTSLHFECMQFQGSPAPFSNYEYLESLTFINNEFTEFPREFCANICSLKSITVEYQQITKLSDASFYSITIYLENLYLRFNELKTIEPATFSRFTCLKTLDLGFNQLETLQPKVFNGLSCLETLDLRANLISTIKPEDLAPLTALRVLFLDMNKLENLPKRVFSSLTNLEVVQLHHNKMNTDPSALLMEHDKLLRYTWGSKHIILVIIEDKSMLERVVDWVAYKFT